MVPAGTETFLSLTLSHAAAGSVRCSSLVWNCCPQLAALNDHARQAHVQTRSSFHRNPPSISATLGSPIIHPRHSLRVVFTSRGVHWHRSHSILTVTAFIPATV